MPPDLVSQLENIERADGLKGGTPVTVARGQTLTVSNLGKVFFPTGETKGDILRYYATMAKYVVPVMRDRPLVLKRFPNGITSKSFYQQNAPDDVPSGVRVELIPGDDGEEHRRVVGGDLLTLLWTIQLGAIAIDPWNARIQSLDTPDYAVLDLDPGPDVPFGQVVDVALLIREALDAEGLHSVPKTSGSRGIHVYVPLPIRTASEAALQLAKRVATRVADSHPEVATVKRALKARPAGTVYVDYVQNMKGKTVAGAYAVRARPGAMVSTPLQWAEVTSKLDPRAFTIHTIPGRVARLGDLWAKSMKLKNSKRAVLALVACIALSRASMAQGRVGGPFPRPVGTHEVAVEKAVMVPMRDGVRMATDIYRPKDMTGALPTILIRTPYNKSANPNGDASAQFFASHGYGVVVQDVRGKFASEGQFRVYEGDMTDWTDAFDWIDAQSWSTGRIGTYGCSYLGEGQIVAAQQRNVHHVAAIVQAAGGNLGRVGRRRQFWGSVEGGAFSISINFGWMPVYASVDKGARPMPKVDLASYFLTLPVIDMPDRAGSPSWDWHNFLERSPDDQWWDARGYLTDKDSVGIAALHVSSWFDMAEEALTEAEIFRRNGVNERARTGQYAIISPTTHCSSERAGVETRVGDLMVGDARLHYFETYLAWFDRWLRGNEHALDSLPRVQYYVIGRNEWKKSDVWPVKGMREIPYFLRSDGNANTLNGTGRLSLTAPTREKADTFTYDPGNPVPSRGGSICCTGNPKDQPGSYDNADIEQRPDVLVYTGDALREGMELTGPIRAVVHLSSRAPDTDVTVKLLDVFPDGRAMNMQEGITRVRYRDGFDKARMMQPDKVYEVPVDLHATSWYLPAGHKLRVEISSSDFPRFDRNLNTGGRNYDETTFRPAVNSVHHSSVYSSRIVLPVVR